MRLPSGLSACLWRQEILRTFRGEPAPSIFRFSPLVKHFPPGSRIENTTPETEWHTPEVCVSAAKQARAPVVWIDSVEPLLHPNIGKVTAAVAQSGRFVFLHTSGMDFRKRIHEFQAVPQLFFAFEIEGDEIAQSEGIGGLAVQNVAEAVRVARLSGFFVCIHVSVGVQTSPTSVVDLFRFFETKGVDGVVASSCEEGSSEGSPAVSGKHFGEIVEMIPSRGWRKFSRLLEESRRQNAAAQELQSLESREAEACEETA